MRLIHTFTDRRFVLVQFPRVSLVASLSILALAACAKERAKPADSSVAPKQAGDPTPNVVTFHAKDFGYDGPAEIPAGLTTFKLVNDGPSLHHMNLVRLDSGKTIADFQAATKT